jgi:NADH-quinone oxidoreductase subunit C
MEAPALPPVLERLAEKLGEQLLAIHQERGELAAVVAPSAWREAARLAKEECGLEFNLLVDLTVVDYLALSRTPRFEVVAHFFSLPRNQRLRLKAPLAEEEPELDSLTGLWANADWLEREAYDMFGIRFRGHPDLRRILLYEEFEGHALRKDYPLRRQQPLLPLREVVEPRSMVSEPLRFPPEPRFKT